MLPLTETMVTPSASEIRKNAASEASSLSSVARAIRPAPKAIRRPAIRPPPAMANRLRPASRKPIAAPGQNSVRHGVADQAHPPQHQKHADRRRAQRQCERADQRTAHEFEIGERRDQGVVDHVLRAGRSEFHAASTAQASACSSKASHMRRALLRFSAVKTSRVAPQATGSRASSRLCGKDRFDQIDVVKGGKHGALFAVPAPHQVRAGPRRFLHRWR